MVHPFFMLTNKFLDLNLFKIKSSIGEGASGKVYRVVKLETGEFYAAKVSKFMVDESTQDEQSTILLFREVNLMSLLNYPSILKFIGYCQTNFDNDPCPTIVSEFATNGSLRGVIDMEKAGISPDDWNATKKLINIFGIAAGLMY